MHGPSVSPAHDLHTAPRQKGTMCRISSYGLRSCDLHCGAHREGGVASVVGHRRDATWQCPPRYGRRCTEAASSLVSSEGCCASAPSSTVTRPGGAGRRPPQGRADAVQAPAGGRQGACGGRSCCLRFAGSWPARRSACSNAIWPMSPMASAPRRYFEGGGTPARAACALLAPARGAVSGT